MKNLNFSLSRIATAFATTIASVIILTNISGCKKEEIKVAPTLTTSNATNITSVSATAGGAISDDGGAIVTAYGVCWSINQTPTTADSKVAGALTGSQTGTVSSILKAGQIATFSGAISGLQPGTTYYARAYATNSIGTAYGEQVTFTTQSVLPVLTTTELLGISINSATAGGNITSDGGASVIARGVCWSTLENPTTNDQKTLNGMGSGIFSSSITGLAPGTRYYIRAYATNSVGTAYGNQLTATTLVDFATLTTAEASEVTSSSANCGGNITANGGADITARGLCWSTSQTPTIQGSKTTNGTGSGVFTGAISGLAPGTTYFVRAYATNSAGTSYGNEVSFKTQAVLPSIATVDISNLGISTLTTGGNVTNDGGATVTERGICWSTNQTPTIQDSRTSSGTGVGSFSINISGLTPDTKYYFRAFATNSIGTAYGEPVSATTLSSLAVLTTVEVTNITINSAISGGNVTHQGSDAPFSRGVCWSTSQNPTITDNIAQNPLNQNSFTCNMTGLRPGTTYYVRAFATNSIGTGYGNQVTFRTEASTPELTTVEATLIASNSARCGGNITTDNGSTVTARGVCWSTQTNPVIQTGNHTSDGSGTGTFESNISGLTPGTKYYVRAYATNGKGTEYGVQISFTTLPELPSLTTTNASSITFSSAISGGSIQSNGGSAIITQGVCLSVTQMPTISDRVVLDLTHNTSFSSTINELSPGTTYYLRAFATTQAGTGYGNQISFQTTTTTPELITLPPDNISSSGASTGGNITSDGGASITARGVCWSTVTNPVLETNNFTTNGTGTGSFESTITGLNPETKYYIRAYATNSAGTSYGTLYSFTTQVLVLPTVATPVILPTGGTYTSAQTATITCSTSDADIRYTTNGNDPTISSTLYTGGISVSSSMTIKARAFKTGWNQSLVASQSYVINIIPVVVGTTDQIQHIDATGDFKFKLESLSGKDVYFIFTNKNTTTSKTLPTITGNAIYKTANPSRSLLTSSQTSFPISGKPSISDFNSNPRKYPKTATATSQSQPSRSSVMKLNAVGETGSFFDDNDVSHTSTVRKVITANGKNLIVWVDDACWGSSSTKKHYVTQEMLDLFTPKFLNTGTDDDIYEWVTNICGAPWGTSGYSNLITATDDIHIWLTDIDEDNSDNGGVVGYFWGKHNFLKTYYTTSNEKLMFTLDAVMFATPTGGSWELTDYWPSSLISTLAHEFQHMIYFYQKQIKNGLSDSNSAVNEMNSQCVEDLVSNKILANGPRGVPYATAGAGSSGITSGRLPLYNQNNNRTLLDWSSSSGETYINYSKTYALGAFLMRNYGGANLITQIAQNTYTGVNCVVNAVNTVNGTSVTYETILKNFGAANLLSDNTSMSTGYRFNTGTWSNSTIGTITYQLGSINLYNYSPNPYIYSTLPSTQNAGSNIYYLAGSSLSGTKEWSITGLNSDVKLTVVIK